MARTIGATGRRPKNTVKSLKAWLKDRKVATALATGCGCCGDYKDQPEKLVWAHMNPTQRDFKLSDGPTTPGMTLERLEAETEKCTLVCRKHFHGWLKENSKPVEPRRDTVEVTDLNYLIPSVIRDAIFQNGIPQAIQVSDEIYVLVSQERNG